MDRPGGTKVFVIPRKNVASKESQKRKDKIRYFVYNTVTYIGQHHRMRNS
jgi:hypothetical protein